MRKNEKNFRREPSSFRDPSGLIFYKDNKVYRQINNSYSRDFTQFVNSGLYSELIKQELLIPYKPTSKSIGIGDEVNKVLELKRIPFISYPYEWCFSQLKDAALLTLKIQKMALSYNFSLKDASAYNIQFLDGKPIFIDHLSFEQFKNKPWIAYRQFCQHFLGPLLLSTYRDTRLIQLLRIYLDGIPIDLTSKLLPKKTYFKFSTLSHIHLHALNQRKHSDSEKNKRRETALTLTKESSLAILKSLENIIKKLKGEDRNSEWGNYYTFTNYSKAAFQNKKNIIARYLKRIKPKTVWDMGANTGEFSRLASKTNAYTVSFDIDPVAAEKNYLQIKTVGEKNILPLILDLSNPSSGLGWGHEERKSLIDRGPADMVLALALIHHLAISNNLPFERVANFFAKISKFLVVEFVPKEDSQVQKLLQTREDIFTKYNKLEFEKEFKKYFSILMSDKIKESKRILYLLKSKQYEKNL